MVHRRIVRAIRRGVVAALVLGAAASPATAELPDTPTLLSELGFSADEVRRIGAGEIVRHSVESSSDRELTTGLAFQVPIPPDELVKNAKRDLMDQVDENMKAHGAISNPAKPADFSKLALPADEAKAYREAEAGDDLNLSSEEIAAFQGLGEDATPDAVAQAVRAALLARTQAYQQRGLAGMAAYDRGGETRSPAEELRIATKAAQHLAKYAPDAHALLVSYPAAKPPGTEEIFRWTHFEAHGSPTIALNHVLLVPDGEAWILAKRQLYVSTGYNAEQALAAFLPSQAGTVVVYATRTSTDQVTGFGGGAKRSIGSKLLASQLEGLFEKARAQAR